MEITRKDFLALSGAGALSACATSESIIGDGAIPATSLPPQMQRASVEQLHSTHLSAHQLRMLSFSGLDIVNGKRDGARIQDAYTNKWYWDCHRLGSTYSVGHRNKRVIAALRSALEEIEIGNLMFLSQYRAVTASKLAATTDGTLPGVVFTATGSEANEAAIKAARRFTKRKQLVCFEGAYHGATLMTMAVSGDDQRLGLYDIDEFDTIRIPFNDLERAKSAITSNTAALIAEPTVAQLGFVEPQKGYWAELSAHCESVGALIILDEVQTGGGATGSFWHYQQLDFTPDILVTGKWPSGGIFPNAFALMRKEVHEDYTSGVILPHPTTFGGSELGCVVTSEVIDILSDPDLLQRVQALSKRFADGFSNLPVSLNRNGLCMAIIDDRRPSLDTMRLLLKAGVLVVPATHNPNAIEFRPVLTITDEEADEIIRAVQLALA